MINRLLITALLNLSLAAAFSEVAAKDLDDAVDAMRIGDFAEAYCIMRPLAESGDADSQYNIGWMYLNGYGLRVDDSLALEWWQKASQQGHTDASFSIGMLYSLGEGEVARDLDQAIDYYMIAVEDGHDDAVTLVQSMMMRNDRSIRSRLHSIINQHGARFGLKYQVKAKKLNARSGASVNKPVLATLLKGQAVLEIFRQGRWSQVVVLGDEAIDQTVWVYNPMLEEYVDKAADAVNTADTMSNDSNDADVAEDINDPDMMNSDSVDVDMIDNDLNDVDKIADDLNLDE